MRFIFGKEKSIGNNYNAAKKGEGSMKDVFASKLKELRRERGMSQEQLANVCGVSVQAVSKWECAQSYPDIELLGTVADTFGVTIDALLRECPPAEEHAANDAPAGTVINCEFPDDGVMRVVQYIGNRLVGKDDYNPKIKIPLAIPDTDRKFDVEIWGSADVEGNINGSLTADGDVECGNVGGMATANGDIECGNVGGMVTADGDINCGNVSGDVTASGDVDCGGIGGNVSAEGDVDCGEVGGSVTAEGDVSCGEVGVNVTADGSVDCGNVGGNVTSDSDVDCGEVGGSVTADGNVDCGDVEGNVRAEGDVTCGSVMGGIEAEGSVTVEGAIGGGQHGKKKIDMSDVDLSNLGDYVSRTVNEAMEAAFGKQKADPTEVNADDDMLIKRALEIGLDSGKLSTSVLQRRMSIGYGRARSLIERLEALGYINPSYGKFEHTLRITRKEFEELFPND